QLERFRAHRRPLSAINAYLLVVAAEAESRGYAFDRRKIGPRRGAVRLRATRGQLAYEWQRLLGKLARRSPQLHRRWRRERDPQSNPLFAIGPGAIEPWERRAPRHEVRVRGG
ncbi:MAG TPA: hypothetical protein VKQ31_03660, partial [Steroidobacteraceae bacterium]|nr:hypothetical protein [Steroidobacteraceae bacterium]